MQQLEKTSMGFKNLIPIVLLGDTNCNMMSPQRRISLPPKWLITLYWKDDISPYSLQIGHLSGIALCAESDSSVKRTHLHSWCVWLHDRQTFLCLEGDTPLIASRKRPSLLGICIHLDWKILFQTKQ